mgnify:CR=1 FL=1
MAGLKHFLKELRAARGWSQEELASRAGTSNQMIGMLERNERRMSTHWMERLAAALECHPLDLLDGGPERLKPRARELQDAMSGLTEPQQEAIYRGAIETVRALTPPPKRIKKKSDA